jgi:hypothetical protein
MGFSNAPVRTDPGTLIASVQRLTSRGGAGKVTTDLMVAPNPAQSVEALVDWNPDWNSLSSSNLLGGSRLRSQLCLMLLCLDGQPKSLWCEIHERLVGDHRGFSDHLQRFRI